jgi:hypothetical protein
MTFVVRWQLRRISRILRLSVSLQFLSLHRSGAANLESRGEMQPARVCVRNGALAIDNSRESVSSGKKSQVGDYVALPTDAERSGSSQVRCSNDRWIRETTRRSFEQRASNRWGRHEFVGHLALSQTETMSLTFMKRNCKCYFRISYDFGLMEPSRRSTWRDQLRELITYRGISMRISRDKLGRFSWRDGVRKIRSSRAESRLSFASFKSLWIISLRGIIGYLAPSGESRPLISSLNQLSCLAVAASSGSF